MFQMFSQYKCNLNKCIFLLFWILLFWWILASMIIPLRIPGINQIHVEGLLEARNNTNQIPDTTQIFGPNTMLKRTCDLWNVFPNKTTYKILYYFTPGSNSCQLWESANKEYENYVRSIFIFVMFEFIIGFLLTIILMHIVRNSYVASQITITVILILFLLSVCINFYDIRNERAMYEYTSGQMYNINGNVFVSTMTSSDMTNSISVSDQFSLIREICIADRANINNARLFAHATFNNCEAMNGKIISISTVIKIFVIIALFPFLIVSICYDNFETKEHYSVIN